MAARDAIVFALIEGPPNTPEAMADRVLRSLSQAGVTLVTDAQWDERMDLVRSDATKAYRALAASAAEYLAEYAADLGEDADGYGDSTLRAEATAYAAAVRAVAERLAANDDPRKETA